MENGSQPSIGGHDGRPTTSRVRRLLRPVAAFGAAAALLAAAVGASTASAAEPNPDCDGVAWSASVPAGENPYAMLTVTVKFDGDPGACSMAFSMAAYETEGPTWPTSGTQTLVDFQTATIDAANPSATLTVAQPECFGQTDFYLGSTKYDGVEAPLPHYPGSPAPYDKISGSQGGQACEEVAPPPPAASPTEGASPSGEGLGVGGTEASPETGLNLDLAAGGGAGGGITPPPTDTAAATAPGQGSDASLVLLLVAIGGVIGFSLLMPARMRNQTRR